MEKGSFRLWTGAAVCIIHKGVFCAKWRQTEMLRLPFGERLASCGSLRGVCRIFRMPVTPAGTGSCPGRRQLPMSGTSALLETVSRMIPQLLSGHWR
ncbi:hypothetical protein D3C75_1140340 [compost metagenome]